MSRAATKCTTRVSRFSDLSTYVVQSASADYSLSGIHSAFIVKSGPRSSTIPTH